VSSSCLRLAYVASLLADLLCSLFVGLHPNRNRQIHHLGPCSRRWLRHWQQLLPRTDFAGEASRRGSRQVFVGAQLGCQGRGYRTGSYSLLLTSLLRRRTYSKADLGSAHPQDLSAVLSTSPDQLASYSLIIAVNVDPTHLLPLSDIAWNNQIPFLKVRTVGFYGSLRVQVNEIASELALSSPRVPHPLKSLSSVR